jgi:hypothetical protein
VGQRSHFFCRPSPAARPWPGGDGGTLLGGTSSDPGAAADAVQERRSVRCATVGEKTATKPSWMCRGARLQDLFRLFAASLVDRESRCAESGENARRTQTEPLTETLDCIATSQLRPIAGFLER